MELSKLSIWFKGNKLSLNTMKTKFIIFRTKQKRINPISIQIDNIEINEVSNIKFLGIIIDQGLTWKHHIKEIEKKVSKNVGVIIRAKRVLNKEALHLLYCSLVLPYLQYCVLIWYATYKAKTSKLAKLQKKVIRIIDNADRSAHTSPVLKKLNVLYLEDLAYLDTAVMMYKITNNMAPINLKNIINKSANLHKHNTRAQSNGNLFIPYAGTNIKLQSFGVSGCKIWNSLESHLKNFKSIPSFKSQLKKSILKNY